MTQDPVLQIKVQEEPIRELVIRQTNYAHHYDMAYHYEVDLMGITFYIDSETKPSDTFFRRTVAQHLESLLSEATLIRK